MAARKSERIPSFRHHKSSGQGFVELRGHRHYLGRYDKPETLEAYHRLIAEWLANGRELPVEPDDLTVAELMVRFWRWAEGHYRKPDGTQTGELSNFRYALRPLDVGAK